MELNYFKLCKQLNSTPAAGCQRLAVDSNTQTTYTNLNTQNLSENLNLVTIRQNLSDKSQQTSLFVVNYKSLGFNSKAAMITTDDVNDMPNHLGYSIANQFKLIGNDLYKQSNLNGAIMF